MFRYMVLALIICWISHFVELLIHFNLEFIQLSALQRAQLEEHDDKQLAQTVSSSRISSSTCFAKSASFFRIFLHSSSSLVLFPTCSLLFFFVLFSSFVLFSLLELISFICFSCFLNFSFLHSLFPLTHSGPTFFQQPFVTCCCCSRRQRLSRLLRLAAKNRRVDAATEAPPEGAAREHAKADESEPAKYDHGDVRTQQAAHTKLTTDDTRGLSTASAGRRCKTERFQVGRSVVLLAWSAGSHGGATA